MQISAKQAAKLIGISKTAVINAINNNEIAANKNEQGQWVLDAAEAERFRNNREHKTVKRQQQVDELAANVSSTLQAKLDAALEREKLLIQRVSDMSETVQDLRKDKDRAMALLEGLGNNLPKMIADQTAERERQAAAAEGKKSWVQKFFS